jgi:hypothetical protein
VRARHLSNEFRTNGDVAPLIRTAKLQRALVIAVESYEVVTLEQHVGELGEGHPYVVSVRVDSLPNPWRTSD